MCAGLIKPPDVYMTGLKRLFCCCWRHGKKSSSFAPTSPLRDNVGTSMSTSVGITKLVVELVDLRYLTLSRDLTAVVFTYGSLYKEMLAAGSLTHTVRFGTSLSPLIFFTTVIPAHAGINTCCRVLVVLRLHQIAVELYSMTKCLGV